MKKFLVLILTFLFIITVSVPTFAVEGLTGDSGGGPGAGRFAGGEIMMLKNTTQSQMMSYVITTKGGEVIVVDGGLPEDAPHLKEVLKSKGSKVSAWFITHPHSDHVGALTSIINEGLDGITIENIYYNFADMDFYQRNEPYRADTVVAAIAAFEKLPSATLHITQKNEIVTVDNVTVKILNNPYLITHNAINNGSIAFRMEMGNKRILFLGDMGKEAGEMLTNEVSPEELKADYVQMAHHGQYGVDRNVYEMIKPTVAMWNAPEWLYNNDNGGGVGSGTWLTLEVRKWMEEIGVKENFVIKDGDQIIK